MLSAARKPGNKYLMAALVSITASAVLASILFWAGAFGITAAINVLLAASMPQYNPFALLIPQDLTGSRWGLEMVLAVFIAECVVVLFAASALWIRLRNR